MARRPLASTNLKRSHLMYEINWLGVKVIFIHCTAPKHIPNSTQTPLELISINLASTIALYLEPNGLHPFISKLGGSPAS